ncbi:MAG: DNA repair protein RecO [Fusobacterium gastrosuis]|uniref:DNA repair protein RecO n=1 Tax=Fusobacterium TaxID=848 RepID=UPI001F4F759E|nr:MULTISPECIES: DNA repair protein RecO [Fusobacterium]MDD7392413.1 DNA repair protein RecO [Fusobacteriaceae bacterium]MCI5725041.1 DNA repair protein RecO [Fusobacterium sp.]MCI7223261.1 DNA repair protein RecO [Fusobacterium sp.]MDD7409891.1 DNA repair protein RecO [Fusobacteriaceae bacterium]MDY4010571.1 DNA repair protein RecO [Fusobacterium gastrosuis]
MSFLKGYGLVIAKREVEEADRYITVFMEDFGKISALIKGIRKSKKRDKTAVDLIALTNFTFYKKGDAIIISDFNGVEDYNGIKSDYNKINIAFYFLYLINQILVENGKNRKLYNLLLKSLESLNKISDERKNLLLIAYFLYEILKDEGIVPEIEDIAVFLEDKSQYKITSNEQKMLRELQKNNVKKILEDENYKIKDIKKVIVILEEYINFSLELKLDAKRFLWGDLLW